MADKSKVLSASILVNQIKHSNVFMLQFLCFSLSLEITITKNNTFLSQVFYLGYQGSFWSLHKALFRKTCVKYEYIS